MRRSHWTSKLGKCTPAIQDLTEACTDSYRRVEASKPAAVLSDNLHSTRYIQAAVPCQVEVEMLIMSTC